ncbi:TlpA family protein disulfide reductase [bacterium]|nr:TlpA family protein disulfide reductase [bacterium]
MLHSIRELRRGDSAQRRDSRRDGHWTRGLCRTACSGPTASSDQLIGRTVQIGEAHPLNDPSVTISSWPAAAGGNQLILLNFWASWCIPCRDEIPLLFDYTSSFVPGATVLGVLYKDSVGPAVAGDGFEPPTFGL